MPVTTRLRTRNNWEQFRDGHGDFVKTEKTTDPPLSRACSFSGPRVGDSSIDPAKREMLRRTADPADQSDGADVTRGHADFGRFEFSILLDLVGPTDVKTPGCFRSGQIRVENVGGVTHNTSVNRKE